jgi:3',5'-cyclic-AMP phosphodiesterase
MAQYAWATDIHLDLLRGDQHRLIHFGESLVERNPTGIFLSGYLSVTKELVYHLSALERITQRPIYFVLGNHDYFGGNIENVRKRMHDLTNVSPFLRYLPTIPYVALSQSTAVIGHDCWYDANYADGNRSSFNMMDWTAIQDFTLVNGAKSTIIELARKLAHEGVLHIQNGIKQATRYHNNLIILTHYPPFAQAHVHEGQVGDAHAMPWFTNKMLGDMLLQASTAYPNVKFTVLAGHTHGKYDGKITNNLEVHVGGAEYDKPAVQGLIEVL